MVAAIFQDLNTSIVLPASVVLFCTLLFIRKTNANKVTPDKTKNERIVSYKSDALLDYTNIDEHFHEKLVPDENNHDCLNLIKVNYLNLLNNKDLRKEAELSIRKYGVGSCGPRGFYGTIDIHLALENRLAEFMQMEEAVLYSYGFSTISSAIAAYCKKSDIIFCDERISFCAGQGILAAKSKIVYFKHNDTEDLESKLKEYETKEKQTKKPFSKFLLVEGIYRATGKLCPLPKLMLLREKYKLRIFIDESISFGVLGKGGRGITEHYNVNRSEVDMIMASMEGAIGSVAGFCVGSSFIIDHQRLSGIGYVFSASLPPFLSHVAILALNIFESNNSTFQNLNTISIKMDQSLQKLPQYLVLSDAVSPLKVFTLRNEENRIEYIKKIHSKCFERNLIMILDEEYINFHVNITMEQHAIPKIVTILEDAYRECMVG